MGKAYRDEGYKFYFFTYEEPVKNIAIKLINRLTATNLRGHYPPDLTKNTNYEFIKAYIKASRTDIPEIEGGKRQFRDLIDSRGITLIDKNYPVEDLYSLIGYLSKRDRIGAIFIDYIQRMTTTRRTQDKRTEIAHISDQVLQIAKDYNLAVILGAQLNRQTGEGSKGPKLDHLKEAGNLEEDANTVLSVYCEAKDKEEIESKTTSKEREVSLEIKVLKNREGEVNGKEILTWDRWTGVVKDEKWGGGDTTTLKF
jgi:hypothetical protein